jgi:hypothetical protein
MQCCVTFFIVMVNGFMLSVAFLMVNMPSIFKLSFFTVNVVAPRETISPKNFGQQNFRKKIIAVKKVCKLTQFQVIKGRLPKPCVQILDSRKGGGAMTNNLAYCNIKSIKAVKSFTVQDTRVYTIKHFTPLIFDKL